MPLNDMLCRTAKSKSKPYKLFDGEGLYLEIQPSGAKYWRLKYRFRKKENRASLGIYPKTTLLEARKSKDKFKREMAKGLDPALVRLEAKQTADTLSALTFELIAKEWHQKNINQWDPRYAQTVLYRFERYVFDEIGSYPIHLIKPVIMLACLQKIEKSGPEMARRIKQLCSHVFKYAIATNRVNIDPTYGLEIALKKYKKGHFASIDVDELPELLTTLQNHKARMYRQTFLALKLMLLTFVRTSELLKAKWTEINFNNKMWTIPTERMKKDKPHLIPLSSQSLEILYELKEMNGNREHIFPSIPRPKKPMSDGTILAALRRMGYKGKMTGHGFRSLAMGVLKEKLGFSHEVVDRQLAHVPKSGNDRAYDRAKFLPQRTEMMQRYADYLTKLMTH